MIRSLLACMLVGSALLAASPGCGSTGVGDPCVPEQEYDPTFNGFDVHQVNLESKSFQCQTRLCLVNHFQGRVSCPYGQDSGGNAPPTAAACTVPGDTSTKITGAAGGSAGATVQAQCTDRTAAKAVYCSCRCANIDGNTNDGANYCKCPDSYTCTQLVSSIGTGNEGLTGAYCVLNGSDFNPNNFCGNTCDPVANKCN